MRQLTGEKAARFLGVSRRTLYRWVETGHAPLIWTLETLAPYVGQRLPKGPPRRRQSIRYTTGRHRFDEVRGKQR